MPPLTTTHGRMGYQPALDGLRALAVAAVLLYHADLRWIPGGFLGVEVFFVISGFLITALLLEEREETGRTDLKRFWQRRARRLLPAMWLLLLAVSVVAVAFLPEVVHSLRADVVASFAYVTNWWLVASEQSYFAALDRPPLLRHLWSLAVEEQWYIVWPLVFVGLSRLLRNRRVAMAIVLTVFAAASAGLMAFLYDPQGDPSRVYYGTDTRASGLLLGAALACVWTPWRQRPASQDPAPVAPARSGMTATLLGIASLVALGALFLVIDEQMPFLYRGGFVVTALCTMIAIAVAVHPRATVFRRALGCAPLVAIGVRSYGLYLWHWPVFVLMRPQDTGWDPMPLLAARLAVTVVLTEVSYRLVELPVRNGTFGRWVNGLRSPSRSLVSAQMAVAVAVVGVLSLSGLGRAMASAEPAESLIAAEIPVAPPPPVTSGTTSGVGTEPVGMPGDGAAPVTSALSGRPPTRITIVGDSVGMTLARNAPAEVRQTWALTDGALEGCGIVDGAIRSRARWRVNFGHCEDWPQRWAEEVTDNQSDLALVALGAWEVFDLRRDDGDLTFGTPEHLTYLRANLDRGIQALRGTGALVGLLEMPCFRPVDGGGLKALPERGEAARRTTLNGLLRDAAAADPTHVVVVPAPTGFCTDDAVASDLNLRWDGVHYARSGARYAWDALLPTIETLRVPET